MTPLDLFSILAKVAGSRTAWARMPSGVECGSKGRENGNRKIVQNVIFVLGPWINPTDLVAPSPGPQWPPHLRLSRPPHFLISLTINLWRYSRD